MSSIRVGGVWVQQAKLTASDAPQDIMFGDSVSISGDTVVVGAAGTAMRGYEVGLGLRLYARGDTSGPSRPS